jgi:hypothetical protein
LGHVVQGPGSEILEKNDAGFGICGEDVSDWTSGFGECPRDVGFRIQKIVGVTGCLWVEKVLLRDDAYAICEGQALDGRMESAGCGYRVDPDEGAVRVR